MVGLAIALSSLVVLAYTVLSQRILIWVIYTVLVGVGYAVWQSRRNGPAPEST